MSLKADTFVLMPSVQSWCVFCLLLSSSGTYSEARLLFTACPSHTRISVGLFVLRAIGSGATADPSGVCDVCVACCIIDGLC